MPMLTRYARAKVLDHLLGIASFTMPGATYLGLFAQDPTVAGLQTSEMAAAGYARIALGGKMSPTSSLTGQAANNVLMLFGPAGAAWGGVAHFGILDAPTGGNMLIFSPLVTAMTVQSGDAPPVS